MSRSPGADPHEVISPLRARGVADREHSSPLIVRSDHHHHQQQLCEADEGRSVIPTPRLRRAAGLGHVTYFKKWDPISLERLKLQTSDLIKTIQKL